MDSGNLKRSAGSSGYARVAVILLLVVGVGTAAVVYFLQQRAVHRRTEVLQSIREPMLIQQKMLQELAKHKNRSISDEDAVGLKRELSADKGERVAIECTMGDLESCYLALEINLIFEASGWIVEEFLFATQATPGQTLILRVRDESMLSRAERLGRLFGSAGLPVKTRIDGNQPFDLKIVIPSKESPAAREGSA